MLQPEREIDGIVKLARIYNTSVGLTGALAFAHDHFAQLLEGPGEALDDLMERIERDPRHIDITILRVEAIMRRRLPTWSMAYSGNSSYVTRQIAPLIGENLEGNSVRIERLIGLLVGLAGPQSISP